VCRHYTTSEYVFAVLCVSDLRTLHANHTPDSEGLGKLCGEFLYLREVSPQIEAKFGVLYATLLAPAAEEFTS
jgi:hypothetical protein